MLWVSVCFRFALLLVLTNFIQLLEQRGVYYPEYSVVLVSLIKLITFLGKIGIHLCLWSYKNAGIQCSFYIPQPQRFSMESCNSCGSLLCRGSLKSRVNCFQVICSFLLLPGKLYFEGWSLSPKLAHLVRCLYLLSHTLAYLSQPFINRAPLSQYVMNSANQKLVHLSQPIINSVCQT